MPIHIAPSFREQPGNTDKKISAPIYIVAESSGAEAVSTISGFSAALKAKASDAKFRYMS